MQKNLCFGLFILLALNLLAQRNKKIKWEEEGDKAYNAKEFKRAVIAYSKALQKGMLEPEGVYIKRGNALAELNDCYSAIKDFSDVIELNPKSSLAYNNRALCYLQLKEFDKAIADEQKTVMLVPTDALAYNNLGLIYSRLEQYNSAFQYFSTAIKHEPGNHLYYYNRGDVYFKTQKTEEAILDFSRSLDIKQNFHSAFEYRGLAYIKTKKWDKAIADFSIVIKTNPTILAYFRRGNCLQEIKQYTAAIEDYTVCVQLNKHTDYYFYRAECYYSNNQFNLAINDLNIVLKKEHRNANALLLRGKAFTNSRNFLSAENDFKELIALEPRIGTNYYEMGMVHFLKQEYAIALKFLNTCNALDKDFAEAFYLKAIIFNKMNEIQLAINEINLAIQLEQENKYLNLKKDLMNKK